MDLSGMLLLESMCEEWISICMWLHVIWICLIHSVEKMECFFFALCFSSPSLSRKGGLYSFHASHPYLLHRRWTALIPRDRCWMASGATGWGGPYLIMCTDKRGRHGRQCCGSDQDTTVMVNAKVGCGGNRSPWLFKEAQGRKRVCVSLSQEGKETEKFQPCLPWVLNPQRGQIRRVSCKKGP